MSYLKESIEIISWARKSWEKRSTLATILFIVLISGLYLSYSYDLTDLPRTVSPLEVGLLLAVLVIISLAWHVSRRPPIAAKDKIGIAIAISCETKKERERMKADFVQALREEIAIGNHQHFYVFELSEYHAEKIKTGEDALGYQRRTRAHLLIYGRCRTRMHEGKTTYALDLHAGVLHRTVPTQVKAELRQDMRSVFPSKMLIPESDEVMGFQLTKEVIRHAA